MKVDELENREYPLGIKAAQVFVAGGTLLVSSGVPDWNMNRRAAPMQPDTAAEAPITG